MSSIKNKKVLLITRPLSPPWDEASKNFAYHLSKNVQGFDITILTNEINSEIPKNIRQEKIYTSGEFGLNQKRKLMRYIMKSKKDFDIIHYLFTPTRLNTFLIKYFARHKETKKIQTVATLREDRHSNRQLKKIMFGDLIITYSSHAKKKLNSLGLRNVEKIYPGIDLEHFTPSSKNIKLMDEWKISSGDFIITYPGEYTRLGATGDILRALQVIFRRIPNSKFIFACRIKNKKDLLKKEKIIKFLESKKLLSRVVFTDTFADMEKIYNLSDIVIFPVRNMKGKFDVPLAVIEAMACGKPVIISDIPKLAEFANSQNSVIIEKGNPGQLTEAVLNLHQDSSKREKIGKEARLFAQHNFSIRKVAEEYKKIYNTL